MSCYGDLKFKNSFFVVCFKNYFKKNFLLVFSGFLHIFHFSHFIFHLMINTQATKKNPDFFSTFFSLICFVTD